MPIVLSNVTHETIRIQPAPVRPAHYPHPGSLAYAAAPLESARKRFFWG